MTQQSVVTSAFTAALLSLLLYIIATIRATGKVPANPDEYFLARNRILPADFGTAQIAYGLQMSTVVPFFLMAYSGDWVFPAVNIIFYALGIWLFYLLLGRFTGSATKLVGESTTLHAFISNVHDSGSLRLLTSWLTIIGFSGLTAFEIVFGAGIFRALFGGSDAVFYLAIIVLTAYLVVYIWTGGQLATLRADQIQLAFGYAGLHVAVAYLFFDPSVSVSGLPLKLLPLGIVAIGGLMFVVRLWLLIRAVREGGRTYVYILYPLILVSLGFLLVTIARKPGWASIAIPSMPVHGAALWWTIASAATLPIFFQFVDFSNWQRLASMRGDSAASQLGGAKRGTLLYLLESPLSWALPVLMGYCAKMIIPTTAGGGLDAWATYLNSLVVGGSVWRGVVMILLAIAIPAIFLSTADGLMTAIAYACAYDIVPSSRRLTDLSDWNQRSVMHVINAGRIGMAVVVGVVVVLFIVFDLIGRQGSLLLGLFLSFYTPIIAFSPAILLPALCGRRAHSAVVWVALVGASILGIGAGGISCFRPEWQYYAAPIALAFAWGVYGLGILVRPQQIGAGRVTT